MCHYIYNEILLSHEKEEHPAICNNMEDLEGIMLSEISHTENDKNCIISLTYGIKKRKNL